MSFKKLFLAFFLSTPALAAGNFDLKSVPNTEVDQYLVPGSDEIGTPRNLQGLWWLNGNPLADEIMSFANAQWTTIEENGDVVGYRAEIAVYDEGIWAWHDSIAGRFLYNLVRKTHLTYVAKFNRDFTFGHITPVLAPVILLPVEIPSSMLVDFTMTQVNENEYSRDSIVLGQKHNYRFRRIVDGEGKRLPAFEEFLSNAEVPNSLLPVCRLGGDSLPSNCVK